MCRSPERGPGGMASALRGGARLQYVVKGGRSSALTDCWVERL